MKHSKVSPFPSPLILDYLKFGCTKGILDPFHYFSFIFPHNKETLIEFTKLIQFQYDLDLIQTILFYLLKKNQNQDLNHSEYLGEIIFRVGILLLDGIEYFLTTQNGENSNLMDISENGKENGETHSSTDITLIVENMHTCLSILFNLVSKYHHVIIKLYDPQEGFCIQFQTKIQKLIKFQQSTPRTFSSWVRMKDTLQLAKDSISASQNVLSSLLFGRSPNEMVSVWYRMNIEYNRQYRFCLPISFLIEEEVNLLFYCFYLEI